MSLAFMAAGCAARWKQPATQPAGNCTFTFDGSALASGIYFIRARVPGELDDIQKVTLLR